MTTQGLVDPGGADAPAGFARVGGQPWIVPVAVVGTVVAVASGTLAVTWPEQAWRAAAVAAAFIAIVTGAGGLALTRLPAPGWKDHRRLLALCLLFASAFYLGELASLLSGVSTPVSALLALAASLLAAAGIAQRRRSRQALATVRALLQTSVVGISLALLLWLAGFREIAGTASVLVLANCLVLAAVLVLAVRSPDPALRVTMTGAGGLVVIALVTRWVASRPGIVLEQEAVRLAASAAVWPWLVLGVMVAARSPDLVEQGPESDRGTTILAGTVAAACVAVALWLGWPGRADHITWVLAGSLVLALWALEVVRSVRTERFMRSLRHQALTDPMTGVGNRHALAEALDDRRVRRGERLLPVRGTEPVGVLTVDIDRFKDVNELLGSSRADQVLVAVGQALARSARDAGLQLFRIGDDEFVIIGAADERRTRALARHLRQVTSEAARQVPGRPGCS